MKPVNLVLTVAFAIAALSVTVWLGRYQGQVPVVNPAANVPTIDLGELPIPAQGPYGKAVASEMLFDFGMLERGDKGSHTFVIKNEGPGPLRVKRGMTSCGQCTFGTVVPEDEDIPPGKSAEVKIDWKIESPQNRFRQTADVYTTDPDNKKLVFSIVGHVDTPLHLVPDGTWSLGDLSETEPTTVEGFLYSTVTDEIVIDRVECANPLVKVTWEPAAASMLEEKKAKSGLTIKVAIAPGTTIGPLRESIKLHSPIRGGIEVGFSLVGKRPGPIEIKGRNFNAENNVVKLGEFPATEGATAKLSMYVRNCEEGFEAQHVAEENGRVKVRVTPTGKSFGKSKVFDVEVEVPPGASAVRRDRNAEPVVLKLNHPSITEFKMYVDYLAK
jgi:hypothetical protein